MVRPEAQTKYSRWLFWYAVLTAAMSLALIAVGGLVTSHGAGMAVPDWPTTYGYNMFFFPFSYWMGGIFYEHSHRLIASVVGLLVVGLTRWVGGRPSRLPLAIVGGLEALGGAGLLQLGPDWKGAGHFLAGIGGVVLAGAVIWVRNAPAPRPLPVLGWIAFFAVQVQGLLGGLRVVLFKDQVGVFHAALAQLFLVLVCVIALMASRWWHNRVHSGPGLFAGGRKIGRPFYVLTVGTTALIFVQLMIGAVMRHQHAGLAISDFPLAHGKLWPDTDPDSINRYNKERLETTALKPITAFQVILQMVHRIVAVAILLGVASAAWQAHRRAEPATVARLSYFWLGMILVQVGLGAVTIWSNKAADLATAHVVVGALSLVMGAVLWLFGVKRAGFLPVAELGSRGEFNPGSLDAAAGTSS